MDRGRKKGTPKTGGRKAGTPNKQTALLKDIILEALDKAGGKAGGVAYLVKQAKENPTAFLTLLGRVLPTQVSGPGDKPLFPGEIDIKSLTEEQLIEFKKRLRLEPMSN